MSALENFEAKTEEKIQQKKDLFLTKDDKLTLSKIFSRLILYNLLQLSGVF